MKMADEIGDFLSIGRLDSDSNRLNRFKKDKMSRNIIIISSLARRKLNGYDFLFTNKAFNVYICVKCYLFQTKNQLTTEQKRLTMILLSRKVGNV